MPAPDYAEEYAASRHRTREVLAGCTTHEAATVVPTCPAWTVHDLCAHLAGVPADLVARRNPGPDQQAWIDHQVAERAGRSVPELLDEWDEVGPAFEGLMRKLPRAFGGLPSWTPAGQATYGRFMQIRVFDCWMHEQDVRAALDRPGHEEGPAVERVLDEVALAVPYLVGKRAGAPDGSAVRIDLKGGAGRRFDVVVDGRAALVEGLDREPDAVVRTDVGTFMRLVGGRADAARAIDSGAVVLDGDPDLARRVATNLAYTV